MRFVYIHHLRNSNLRMRFLMMLNDIKYDNARLQKIVGHYFLVT